MVLLVSRFIHPPACHAFAPVPAGRSCLIPVCLADAFLYPISSVELASAATGGAELSRLTRLCPALKPAVVPEPEFSLHY